MNLAKQIYELLLKHDCVVIPGLGGFVANYKSARIHPVNHTFYPPCREIVFNGSLNQNDGLLAQSIANSLDISYTFALETIESEVCKIKEILIKNYTFAFDNLGTLSMDKEGNISFVPEKNDILSIDAFGLNEFVSPPVIRPDLRKHLNDKIRKQKAKPAKIRHINSAVRWSAAAAVPLLGILTWASLNFETIKSYNYGESGIVTFFSGNKEVKFYELPAKNLKPGSPMTMIFEVPSEYNKELEQTDSLTIPWQLPVLEINNDTSSFPIKEEEPATASYPINPDSYKFHIIGNCFRSVENAELYLSDIKKAGYDNASLAGLTPGGLHRVSIASFMTKEEAETGLQTIRNEFNNDAWLLEL